MLRKELIRLDVEAKTAEEALRIMAGLFVESGVAKPSYPDAIVAREAQYPTELPATAFDIAVPHTFAEHVNEPEITLHPRLLFMLAITDPKDQIKLLRKIMKLIQNPEALNQIREAGDVDEVYSIVNPQLF